MALIIAMSLASVCDHPVMNGLLTGNAMLISYILNLEISTLAPSFLSWAPVLPQFQTQDVSVRHEAAEMHDFEITCKQILASFNAYK